MSIIQGVFSETILNAVRGRAYELALDDRIKQQFMPNIDVLNAINAAQTARLSALRRVDKDITVQVMWDNACEITTRAVQDCVLGGNKTSTNVKEYALDLEREVGFTVAESDFRNNEFDYQESLAKALLKADKELSEWFMAQIIAGLNAGKGVNAVTDGKGVVVGSDTYIEPAFWTPELMAYLQRVGVINKFTNPILLSGKNLYEQVMISKANQGNDNGKGAAAMYGIMPIYFDLFNIDTINTPDYFTYMLSRGSVAVENAVKTTPEVKVYTDQSRYSMMSSFMKKSDGTPFAYDVHYAVTCGTDDEMKHDFKVKFKGGFFTNPTGCDETNTGILTFICGNGNS